jgi:hypothetical protein
MSSSAGGPSRPWDPFGLWESLAGGLSLPGVPSLPTATPFSPLKPLLDRFVGLVRSRLVGRRITVRLASAELRLTLTDLDVPLDAIGMPSGQLDDVRAAARDVEWGDDLTFERVTATLRNTHVRAGTRPTLVSAPVDLTLTLSSDVVAGLVARHRPELAAEITEDAEPRLRWTARPDWAFLRVSLGVNGTRIRIHPETLVVRDRAVDTVARLPAFNITVPLPADRVRFVDVEVTPRALVLHARVDQWRVPLASGSMEALMRRLSTAASVLDLSRWPRV